MKFTKMHACGNDFIVINGFETIPCDIGKFAERACTRHFGIGADGLIIVCASEKADARMRIINADGSEVKMCGNGVRCAAKYLYDRGICSKNEMLIETGAGVLKIRVQTDSSGHCAGATVDMGIPDTDPAHYPMLAPDNRITVDYNGKILNFFCVNTGVPHAVTFDIFPDDNELDALGSYMEHYPLFPERSNVCFARIETPRKVDMRVWERGCGVTLACGTGSCAVLYAGSAIGLCEPEADIVLDGGTLHDAILANAHIAMTGPAVTVFEGETDL